MNISLVLPAAALLAVTACGQATTSHSVAARGLSTPPASTSPSAHRSVPPSSPLPATPPATSSATPSAARTTTPPEPEDEHLSQPVALPRCPHTTPSPHFATVDAMMRYLAAAWNHHDLDQLCHVTNPNARELLTQMHSEALNLRLDHCTAQPTGDYVCYLDHDYPRSTHRHGVGHAIFRAAPAARPGWYMTVFESCG
jgi:predicted lipid-binding transport protein (Tim44 family)